MAKAIKDMKKDIDRIVDNIKEKGLHELKDDVDLLVQEQVAKMRSKFRKVVTGDEKKRVRDLLDEKKKVPKNVKLFDKLFFTFGVTNIAICQYFMMNAPRWYWIYHCFLLISLLFIRFLQYRKLKYHYFLLDFCYFTNFCLAICRLFGLARYKTLFNAIFICSVGPLPLAVIVWNISFVFHDHEKVTSVLVHILPLMLCYTMRWHGKENDAEVDKYLRAQDFLVAAAGYLFWQVMYYLKTEVLDKEKLDADLEIQTSLRWISTDKKNSFTNFVLKLLRLIGIMKPDEVFQPTTFKTKLTFMTSQFIYTLLTFSVAPLVYYSKTLHLYAIGVIFIISTYLGASYYIEIFSQRYQKKFEEAQSIQNVVRVAAEAAFDSASCLTALELNSGSDASMADLIQLPSGSRSLSPQNNTAVGHIGKTYEPSTPQRRGDGAATPLSPLASSREIMRAATSAFVNEVVCDETFAVESNASDDEDGEVADVSNAQGDDNSDKKDK